MENKNIISNLRYKYLLRDIDSENDLFRMCYEACVFFLLGVSTDDIALTRCCLDIIAKYKKKYPEHEAFTIDGDIIRLCNYSDFIDALDHFGIDDDGMYYFLYTFNPFVVDIEDLYYSLDQNQGKSLSYILDGIYSFLADALFQDIASACPLCSELNACIIAEYINRFIPRFVDFLKRRKKLVCLFDDIIGKLLDILSSLTAIEMQASFDALFDFIKECVREYDIAYNPKDLDFCLLCAIEDNNEHVFFAIADEAKRNSIALSFDRYPTNSLEILDEIFACNQLIPGTEEGYNAFCSLIGCGNPSAEIIKRIYHPTYALKEGESPLCIASSNRHISPDKLGLFISQLPTT